MDVQLWQAELSELRTRWRKANEAPLVGHKVSARWEPTRCIDGQYVHHRWRIVSCIGGGADIATDSGELLRAAPFPIPDTESLQSDPGQAWAEFVRRTVPESYETESDWMVGDDGKWCQGFGFEVAPDGTQTPLGPRGAGEIAALPAASIRAIDRLLRLEVPRETSEEPAAQQSDSGDSNVSLEQIIVAVGDTNAMLIVQAAAHPEWDTDRKLRKIYEIDGRFRAKDSTELAKLLGVTDGRIRQLDAWKSRLDETAANV